MNLIEGGRPRIGCIRRQPSARSLTLSLEEGHPSMGKMAGSSGKKGGRTSGAPQPPGDGCSGRGASAQAVPPAAVVSGVQGESVKLVAQIAEQIRERSISRSRRASSKNRGRSA